MVAPIVTFYCIISACDNVFDVLLNIFDSQMEKNVVDSNAAVLPAKKTKKKVGDCVSMLFPCK